MLQRLAYNIHGVMDVIDADNCKKIIKALEQELYKEENNLPQCEDVIHGDFMGVMDKTKEVN